MDILFTIVHREDGWYVLSEDKSKNLGGPYDSKEKAEERLKQVEYFKHNHEVHGGLLTFDSNRDESGKVRTGVWDYVCVEGEDKKDGQRTEFSIRTLSEMIDNFVRRGDRIPIDWNHQSNYASQNGQPAPALGFYGALAVVWDGKVVKFGCAKDILTASMDTAGCGNGLWALRTDVTEKGDELLPSFRYLSPTFTPEGVNRENEPVGYCLLAVAATNTPWQPGTEINFDSGPAAAPKAGEKMATKLGTLAKLMNMDESSDDKAIKAAAILKMEESAHKAMEEETYNYEESADYLENMAKAYEDAHMEDDEEDAEPSHVTMRRMAAKFRKMTKMEEPPNRGDEDKKDKEDEKEKQMAAHLSTMEATNKALVTRLAKLEAAELDRNKASEADRDRQLEAFADQAIAGGYPSEARAALLTVAKTNFEAAKASVSPFLPKSGAPSVLFDKITVGGAPVGANIRDTVVGGPDNRIVSMSALGSGAKAIIFGEKLSAAVRQLADSTDPKDVQKVEMEMQEGTKGTTLDAYSRYMAAERIITRERPDMVRSASENL